MRDPLSLLAPAARRRLTIVAVLATAALTGVLGVVDVPLRNPVCEHGIVSFELAGSLERASAILDSWDASARVYAALSLGLDYLYPLCYSTTLALFCSWGSRRRAGAWCTVGMWLVWGQWMAAFSDGVENFGLIQVLLGSLHPAWPALAASAATAKFALVIAGALYGVASLLVRPPAANPGTLGA